MDFSVFLNGVRLKVKHVRKPTGPTEYNNIVVRAASECWYTGSCEFFH